jgi:hypothetical protein
MPVSSQSGVEESSELSVQEESDRRRSQGRTQIVKEVHSAKGDGNNMGKTSSREESVGNLPVFHAANRGQTANFDPLSWAVVLLTFLLLGHVPSASAQYSQPQPSKTAQAPTSQSGDSEAYPASTENEPGELQPAYPGEPMNKPPVEAKIGPAKLRVYGTVLLNLSIADSAELGQDVPLWPLPSSGSVTFVNGTSTPVGHIHDTIFSARQSVLGVVLNQANATAGGWNSSALVEFDFFGPTPVDTNVPEDRVLNQPRLRKAYFQLQKGDFKLIAGQDDIIISPLDPVSLSHVAYPLGFGAGDLFGWLPQVRVELGHKWAHNTSTLFQFGILRPAFGDARLADQPGASTTVTTSSGLGERASQPFYQGRLAISHPLHGSPATLGVSGHYGQERVGSTRTLDSWAFAFDYRVPILSKVILRGEGYLGANLVPFGGGILQGVAAVPATAPFTGGPLSTPPVPFVTFHKIGDGGGWAELTFLATSKDVFYAGYSADHPVFRDLLPGSTRTRNAVGWASYFRKLTPGTTIAAEWSNWDFRTTGFTVLAPGPRGPFGRGNVVNIALAYQF